MSISFNPPLAVHFVWNPQDSNIVDSILDILRANLVRDIHKPFSRSLNIPLFFYCSENSNAIPKNQPSKMANRDIVFIFTSVNTLGRDKWKSYIEEIPFSETMIPIPIALEQEGLGHGYFEPLKNLNFLRFYEWVGDLKVQKALLSISHEIFRHGFSENAYGDVGKNSSIKLFLSHAKAGDMGRLHAESLYNYIDNTNMRRFFDATEISPGFKFDEEIIEHIKDSTVIAIGTDYYSSRYWCQREILCAKQEMRPILAVDSLMDFEDRIFPAGSNVPCVHITPNTPMMEKDVLRILNAAMIETIRHHQTLKSLEYYQKQGWIKQSSAIISRPPEIRQVIDFQKKGKTSICYPEPALYEEESDWITHFGMTAYTPLWNSNDREILNNFRIGISISSPLQETYSSFNLHNDHLMRLSQDLARHLLVRSGTIIYGGDLRKDGFTQFILDEAVALKSRTNSDSIHVENHLAWPLYKDDPKMVAWRSKYASVIKTIEHDIPQDIVNGVDKNEFLPPNSIESKYIWSRCLTEMRKKSISSSSARICAGGKLTNYNGKMPGVLEEILLALEFGKPIFLLGAFGGVVSEVCDSIIQSSITAPLTEHWQITQNAGYYDLQTEAKSHNQQTEYQQLKDTILEVNVDDLANLTGLSIEEYKRLMLSPFIDECIHLIIKGLTAIDGRSQQ